ncbi:lysophospholipid acyltransferase family protein [Algivirga pacifica]|uniref:Lysophospholipid acyltransferase family protein n=1 Tax=Algivirga pacifica TaxID=1162670 RepID=A0ABP9DN16_9BACT
MWALKLISKLPFSVLYVLSDFLFFLVYRVVRYRKKVVLENLNRAFPEKPEQEIKQISKDYYLNFTDTVVEIIKSISISKEELEKRVYVSNPEEVVNTLNSGQSIILLASHQCNWEWQSLGPSATYGIRIDPVYKQLSSPFFDQLMTYIRERFGGKVIEKDVAAKEIENRVGKGIGIGLVGDQSPQHAKQAQWVDFLGLDTPFYFGPTYLAKKYNFPAYYAYMHRLKRGYYQIDVIPVGKPPYKKEDDIVSQFAKEIEKTIREHPADWLWSHRRWKLKRK